MIPALLLALTAALGPPQGADDELTIGMSAAFSGPTQDLGNGMRRGIEACFAEVNGDGGIEGRRLRLVALDDGYDPDQAQENAERLIQEGVLALIGNVGTPTARRTVPLANEHRTLLFGAFTGAGLLREDPPDRFVINYRASYAQETAAMVEGLMSIGVRPFELAFFTQNDSYGDAGYEGAVEALERRGYDRGRELPHGRYERNTVRVEHALLHILEAEVRPRAVLMIGAYKPCAAFVRRARRALPGALFLNVSFVGGAALARELGEDGEGVVVTQVVPHPGTEGGVVAEYRASLARHDPAARPGHVSLEGYLVARAFVEGLRRVEGELTREAIVDGIESIGELDLGAGVRLHFSEDRHQGSDAVWPTVIRGGSLHGIEWAELRAESPRPAGR